VATSDDAHPADRVEAGDGAQQGYPRIDCPVEMRLVQHDPTAEEHDQNTGARVARASRCPYSPEVIRVIDCAPLGAPYFAAQAPSR
jgi:hypothetical protein